MESQSCSMILLKQFEHHVDIDETFSNGSKNVRARLGVFVVDNPSYLEYDCQPKCWRCTFLHWIIRGISSIRDASIILLDLTLCLAIFVATNVLHCIDGRVSSVMAISINKELALCSGDTWNIGSCKLERCTGSQPASRLLIQWRGWGCGRTVHSRCD